MFWGLYYICLELSDITFICGLICYCFVYGLMYIKSIIVIVYECMEFGL
jgi:hypothetical protein